MSKYRKLFSSDKQGRSVKASRLFTLLLGCSNVQFASATLAYRFVSFSSPTAPFNIGFSEGIGTTADGRRVYVGFETNEAETEHIYFQKDGLSTFVEPPEPFKDFLLNGFSQNGEICGKYPLGSISKAAYTSGGKFVALPGDGRSVAYRMNSSGRVAGFIKDSGPHRPVIWDNGQLIELDRGGFNAGLAEHVTEDGTVYGSLANDAFFNETRLGRWRNGVLDFPLGQDVPAGNIRTSPGGVLACVAKFPDEPSGPIRIMNGVMERLERPGSLSWNYEIVAVNDFGDMVGFGYPYLNAPLNTRKYYLWRGSQLIDLKSLLQPDQDYMHLSYVDSINNKGEISGGFLNKLTGRYDPGLLVPVPEPSTLLALAVGGAFVLRRRAPSRLR